MPVTLRDIAKRANVSHATVSVVLNQRSAPIISAPTREKVLRVAQELGYQPNHLARALATGRSNIIALWLECPYDPFESMALRHVQGIISESPYSLMLTAPSSASDIGVLAGSKSHWPVDGILAFDCDKEVNEYLGGNRPDKIPLVGIGSFKSTAKDSVLVDLRKGIHDAVRHLLLRHPKRIAMLTCPNHSTRDDIVIDAYCEALDDAGLPMEFVYAEEATRKAGMTAVSEFVATQGVPDALIAYNDLLCVGALAALRTAGISVPKQTAIIGCGGINEMEYQYPPISTIQHPVEEICRVGWSFLTKRLADPSAAPQHALLEAKLVIRESSELNG